MRKGNSFRLPSTMDLTDPAQAKLFVGIANQALQSFQSRLDTIQQIGAKEPPVVSGFSVEGKQGLFNLTWNRIKNVDGYVVIQAADPGMLPIIGRCHIADGQQCSFKIMVGNVAVTASFQIFAYQGPKYSHHSPTVTATTLLYGAAEAAPASPPIAPQHPKVAPVRSGPNLQ
jgi:hypothetical protein